MLELLLNYYESITMDKLFIFALLSLFCIVNIYPQWINQNPVPDGNNLWSTFFINDSTGWIVGSDGFIKKTTNAGLDWNAQNSGTQLILKSVQFVDSNTGWICGEGGLILKTTDGGLNWFEQKSGTIEYLTNIHFCDANTGYIVGFSGTILKTTDSGSSWTSQTSGTTNNLLSVDFIDDFVGYAVGGGYRISNSAIILKTTDGGLNWLEKPLPNGYKSWSSLNTVEFVDAYKGWIGVGYGDMYRGKIYKTTDGGETWTQQYVGTEEKIVTDHKDNYILDIGDGIRSIFFKDANNGYAVSGTIGFARSIIITTDGGSTWIQKCYDWESDGILSIYVNGTGKGWAVGLAGIMYITENNGNSWSQILSGIKSYVYSGDDIYSLFCLNENMSWAVGHRRGGGGGGSIILKTTDGGKIWKTQLYTSGSSKPIRSIYFIDEDFGWALGDNGIWRTTNGGANWTKGSLNGKSLFFINKDIGWLVKETFNIYSEAIFKTTDGGVTWTPQTTQSGIDIFFLDHNSGWVVGKNGGISKSTDGGESWISKTSGTNNDLNSIRFYDSDLGICVGNEGTVLLTTDGGESWVSQNTGTAETLTSVEFTNSTTVWISGSNGTILHTMDLGNLWTNYDTVTGNNLTSLCFINNNTGWIGGTDGTIFKYQSDIVPVELMSFTAGFKKNEIQLNWRTATEVNNYGFEIERRFGEEEWNTIGFVEGHYNSISPKSYFYSDNCPIGENKLQYRLKQIDTDGCFKYSDIVEVDITPSGYELTQNYPNPFNPNTVIEFSLPENVNNVRLFIYNELGEKVAELINTKLVAGRYSFHWNAQSFATGIYIYELRTENFSLAKKMLLLK